MGTNYIDGADIADHACCDAIRRDGYESNPEEHAQSQYLGLLFLIPTIYAS